MFKRTFNASLFKNTSDKITFSKSKEEKVRADYNGNGSERDGADKIQIIGVKALSQGGKPYIRLVFIDRNGLDNVYHNAALFLNEKKEKEAHPDYYGSVDLDREGHDRLRLAAWIKTGERSGKYLSISVSEFQAKDGEGAASEDGAPAPAGEIPEDDSPF